MTQTKPRPDHYKVVCISMYTRDLDELDAKVAVLKERGWTKMSKSQLIRIALAQLDVAQLEAPIGDNASPRPPASSAAASAASPASARAGAAVLTTSARLRLRKKLRLRPLTHHEISNAVMKNPELARVLSSTTSVLPMRHA